MSELFQYLIFKFFHCLHSVKEDEHYTEDFSSRDMVDCHQSLMLQPSPRTTAQNLIYSPFTEGTQLPGSKTPLLL